MSMMNISEFLKRLLIVSLFSTLFLTVSAQSRRVSLLTCSPGEEVYALFGHTAIRVVDEAAGIDVVFNYGLFSFDEPHFIWRFVLGETDYLLGAIDYEYFLGEYAIRGSGVTEQVLNIDDAQASRLMNALVVNSMPANRKYRYNFFYNNCTTKARDKIFEVLDGSTIVYNTSSVGEIMSFRDILHLYTDNNLWARFGIDLLLGAPADIKAGRDGAQFAPLIFKNELADASIESASDTIPLVAEQNELLLPEEKTDVVNNLTPFNVSLLFLLFTLVVMLIEKRTRRCYWGWDILLMGLQGVAGLLLAFMVLFSEHPAVDVNWLLIWLNPLPLFILPIYIHSVRKGKKAIVLWLEVVMILAFIVASPFVSQYFPPALYPFAIAILSRSIFEIYKKNICALD